MMTTSDQGASVVIRPYRPTDQPQVRALHDRTPPAGSSSSSSSPQYWPADLDLISEAYLAFWVAVDLMGDGEQVVGMVGLEPTDSDVPAFLLRDRSGLVRLARMRVAPERQRQGIGRRLTMTAIAWARARSFQTLILETTSQQTAALALYRSLGFVEVGRSTCGRFELVWFELPLVQESDHGKEGTP